MPTSRAHASRTPEGPGPPVTGAEVAVRPRRFKGVWPLGHARRGGEDARMHPSSFPPPAAPDTLDACLAALPRRFPGPGGAAAVLRNGQVLVRHAWGFANAERRIPFTPRSLFRICSITKQFTCASVLAAYPDPSVLDADVHAMLPHLEGAAPGALHLAHNQSGLRDYWAVAMLLGSPAEAPFGEDDARSVVSSVRSLQFAPGTRYSYVNQNFRILSDILEARTGRSFAEHLAPIFESAGMGSALLAADTRALPDGTEGYEGTAESGFRPAENRIFWTGDAGMAASLDDLIAWERHIDAARDDSSALATRLAAPVAFADGAAAPYGFGLARWQDFGRAVFGHGGGLRGWRSQRLYVPSERLSVVVLFNHLADASAAARALLAAALGAREDGSGGTAPGSWAGRFREPQTGLAVRIAATREGRLRLRFGPGPELLDWTGEAATAGPGRTRLSQQDGALWMERPQENFSARLEPLSGEADPRGVAGHYTCAELGAALDLVDAGGALYGAFSGPLGRSRMEQLVPLAADTWLLPCPRALDYSPPGDWTLSLSRDGAGRVEAITLGCWLARGLRYARTG